MIKVKTIIIGAGAAGLMAANFLGDNFIVLEKNNKPGKKILISGSGQCNYTNVIDIRNFFDKYGEAERFIRYGLSKFSNRDTIEFFNNKDLESFIREDGKVFPITKDASNVVEILTNDIHKNIVYNSEVKSVKSKNENFIIKTNNEDYFCKNLIIATGGRTYPKMGTTGDGYKIAEELDIKVTKLRNGLCGVNIYDDYSELSGITLKNTKIDLYRNNSKLNSFKGDLLFTHIGLTGPVIINNSRNMKENDVLKVNFTDFSSEEFEDKFIKKMRKNPKKNILNILKDFDIPKKVLEILTKEINQDTKAAELSKKIRKKIVENLTAKVFKIKKVGTLHNSMVTVGGVSRKEINKKTMESRKYDNLYFIGEVLDVDGDTGGYNIQWAFSSAYLASKAILKKQKSK